MQVNMLQAKTELSKLIASLEKNEQEQIYIARDGVPVAVLMLYQPDVKNRTLGLFNGKYAIPDGLDEEDPEISEMMSGGQDEYTD